MKTIVKFTACLFFAGVINCAFAQQQNKPAAQTSKKQKSKKEKTGIDNKIAVSDEAQTADKGTKGTKSAAKKDGGISNK